MSVETICICGAGTMGSGIAHVAASAGFKTILYEVNETVLAKAAEKLERDLTILAGKGRISVAVKEETLQRINFTSNIDQCIADLVIEAIIENMDAKVALLQELTATNTKDTLLTSNTSALSISQLAAKLQYPERVAGLHFFNPAPLMKLVEVVKGEHTREEVVRSLSDVVYRMKKTPVVCKDSPGFIVNRVARPFYLEALRLVEEGKADYETIDRMLEASGFKMGPFKLMDLIGNDINYSVSCSLFEQMNRPERLKPSYLQKEKVEKGALGRKTKQGYYKYD